MNTSNAQPMKLPDELLLIILKKLDNLDVLDSLYGLSTRLDQIIRDPYFTTEISFIGTNAHQSTRLDTFIDRFCLNVVTEIHHQIRWLKKNKVLSTSMERALLAADYPNLSQLDIFIPKEEPVLPFNGEKTLRQQVSWCLSSSKT